MHFRLLPEIHIGHLFNPLPSVGSSGLPTYSRLSPGKTPSTRTSWLCEIYCSLTGEQAESLKKKKNDVVVFIIKSCCPPLSLTDLIFFLIINTIISTITKTIPKTHPPASVRWES